MSRIDDLLATHCPNGVKCKSVGSAFAVVATARGVPRTDYAKGSAIPVVDQGQSAITGFTDDLSLAVPLGEYVVFGDHTRAVKWVDFQFAPGADGTKVLQARGDLLPKFGFYALDRLDIPSRGYNRHWTILRDLRIPVPPLEVQREIVRILDQFSQLEAELEAELEARRRQYRHYRDQLLNSSGPDYGRWAPMSEVGTLIRGRRFTRADVVERGIPSIHYGEIYTRYGVVARQAFTRVREDLRTRLRFAEPGDVVIAAVGETVEDVGKAVAWLGDGPVAIHDDTFLFRSDLEPTFVSHFMQSSSFNRQKEQYVARAKIKRLSADGLGRILIPVLPREEQERVVDLLDRFESLVGDLSDGLPAELAARRKQYEHYRDRLLTFTEASA